MNKYSLWVFFLFFAIKAYNQTPINDTGFLSREEANMIAPQYKYGYKLFCKDIANLFRSLNMKLYKNTGCYSSFELVVNKYGKVASIKYLSGTKNAFNKIEDTLGVWANHLYGWKPAYDLSNAHKLIDYTLTINVFLESYPNTNNISVLIEGIKSRTLYKYSAKY